MFCACTTLASILPFYLCTILCACITLASILSLYLSTIFCAYNTLASILSRIYQMFYQVSCFYVHGMWLPSYPTSLMDAMPCIYTHYTYLYDASRCFLRRFDQRIWPSNRKNTVDTIGEKKSLTKISKNHSRSQNTAKHKLF